MSRFDISPIGERFWMTSDAGMATLNWLIKNPRAVSAIGSKSGRTRGGAAMQRNGDVAIIDINGTLTKYENFLTGIIFGTATADAKQLVDAAAADPKVSAIMLVIESPGGQSQGTMALADSVYAAARVKPTMTYVEDLCASAAYWIGSSASSVWASKQALVGSIGTFCVVCDFSGAAAQAGVRVHVVQSEGGKFKGMGTPGTEVTPEQIAEIKKVVDSLNADFVAGVARGRKMSLDQAQSLADGRIHVGAQAVAAGLVDRIGTFDEAMAALMAMPTKNPPASNKTPAARSAAEPPARQQQQQAGPDPVAEWNDAVGLMMQAAQVDRRRAGVLIAKKYPKLHAQFVNAANRRDVSKVD